MTKRTLQIIGLGFVLLATTQTTLPAQTTMQTVWSGIKRTGAAVIAGCIAIAEYGALANDYSFLKDSAQNFIDWTESSYRRTSLSAISWNTATGIGVRIPHHALRLYLVKELATYAYYGELKKN